MKVWSFPENCLQCLSLRLHIEVLLAFVDIEEQGIVMNVNFIVTRVNSCNFDIFNVVILRLKFGKIPLFCSVVFVLSLFLDKE